MIDIRFETIFDQFLSVGKCTGKKKSMGVGGEPEGWFGFISGLMCNR